MRMQIKELKVETLLGVYEEERKEKRKVTIDLDIIYDAVIKEDKLSETLDYAAIEKSIIESLAKQKFQLLESLAEHIAYLVLKEPRVQSVDVQLGKPGALKHAQTVIVEYKLKRQSAAKVA